MPRLTQFVIKAAIFSLPVLALFALPFAVFLLGGELLPVNAVVALQQQGPKDMLYLSAFTGINEKPYKVLQTLAHDPQIVTFGRSRTLTFRSDFFKPDAGFYNAGVPMHKTAELSEYLKQVPNDGRLKVMLLDLSNFFKDDVVPEQSVQAGKPWTGIDLFLTSGWREAYIQYVSKKFTLAQLIREKASVPSIGINALIHHEGYREDGSLSRGSIEERAAMVAGVPAMIRDGVANIQEGKTVTTYDSSLDSRNVAEISAFLDLCRTRGVYVVGYLSPYAHEIYQKIQSMGGDYGIAIHAAPKTLSDVFVQRGFNFYDLRDMDVIGSSDAELYDAGHPTEKATLRLLQYLTMHEPKLRQYVDAASLPQKIAAEKF